MNPRLNAIQIILRSFIHYRTNYSSFFYPLPSLKIGGELPGANCPGGELEFESSVTEFLQDLNFDAFSPAQLYQQRISRLQVVMKKSYNFPKKSELSKSVHTSREN